LFGIGLDKMNNNAYRVIWNEELGSYVAVPEFASARGKKGGQ